jgi:hypothetical protein
MRSAAGRVFAAVAFAILFAGSAPAADPKSVDLSDLKDAVKAATKKGANVDEVGKALDAVAKHLAEGWTAPKPDDAPPAELTALREAVEAAARKGENVDAIREELDAVEKALLGRALTAAPRVELPWLRMPKPDPDPTTRFGRGGFGGRGDVVIRGGGGGIVIGGGLGGPGGPNFRSVTIANGNFTVKASQGGVDYELTGALAGDDADAVKVVITVGEKKIEAENLKKVPEEHREAVDKLVKSIRR